MSRIRTAELLAAAGLAPQLLAREQQRGENEARQTQAWGDALGGAAKGVWSILGPGGALEKNANDDSQLAADKAVADSASTTGTVGVGPGFVGDRQGAFVETPTEMAQKASSPLDSLAEGSMNPYAKDAAARARVNAQKGIASTVQANQDKAASVARQARLDEQTRKTAEVQQQHVASGDAAAGIDRARARLPSIVAAGIANVLPPDEIATRLQKQPGFEGITSDEVLAEHQAQKRHEIEHQAAIDAMGVKQSDEHAAALAKTAATTAKTNAAANPSGVPSTAEQIRLEKLRALRDKNNGTGPPKPAPKGAGSKLNLDAMQLEVQHANELADLYDSDKLNMVGGLSPDAMKSKERIRVEQLAHTLKLGVPSAFSGTTRLNTPEMHSALTDVIGSPDSVDTNAHKSQRARDLAKMLQEEVDAGRHAQPATTTTTTAAPAANITNAAGIFRAMTPEQQDAVRALVAQGLDRTAAVARVQGGG